MPHNKFQAKTLLGGNTFTVPSAVVPVTNVDGTVDMRICGYGEDIYITKQQAMDFFGLVDPADYTIVTPSKLGDPELPVGVEDAVRKRQELKKYR